MAMSHKLAHVVATLALFVGRRQKSPVANEKHNAPNAPVSA
jgi:hypothetical protein